MSTGVSARTLLTSQDSQKVVKDVKFSAETLSETKRTFERNAAAVRETHSRLCEICRQVLAAYEQRLPGLGTLTSDPVFGLEIVEALGNRSPPIDIAVLGERSWPPEVSMGLALLLRRLGPPLTDWEQVARLIQKSKRFLMEEKELLMRLLDQVEFVAPNLCALTGKNFAVRVLAECGGLEALAKLPSDQLRLIGARDTYVFYGPRCLRGAIFQCSLLREILAGLENAGAVGSETNVRRIRCIARKIANSIALMARVDLFESTTTDRRGEMGARAHAELLDLWRKEARCAAWHTTEASNTTPLLYDYLRPVAVPRPWEKRRGRGGRKRTRRKQRARSAAKAPRPVHQSLADEELELESGVDEDEA